MPKTGIEPRSAALEVDAFTSVPHLLVGLVVKASASRAEGPGFESCRLRDFSGSSHTSDLNVGTPVATFQAPGVMGPVLGLVGPVSVYWRKLDVQLRPCGST